MNHMLMKTNFQYDGSHVEIIFMDYHLWLYYITYVKRTLQSLMILIQCNATNVLPYGDLNAEGWSSTLI